MIDLPHDWRPHRTVAVIVPAFGSADTLDLTMASLARQDYPEDLVEVVVVDDGSPEPYVLPEVHHKNTRIVRPEKGWGRANACHEGVLATTGEILVWLDSDIVVPADHLTAHLRWHDRLKDVATKGDIRFVDSWDVAPSDIAGAQSDEDLARQLEVDGTRSQWVEDVYARTDDLNTDSPYVFSTFTGAAGSVSRDLYMASGGMDTSLALGEDSDLAYRLAARGAVFVPARDAVAWHLGPTNAQRRLDDVLHHDKPYLAQRAPLIRRRRTTGGRVWRVPMVHAVVVAQEVDAARARVCVDHLLASSFTDLHVSLVAPWSRLHDGRRPPLDDPDLELRLLREWLEGEPRVSLVEQAPQDVFPAAFRLDVPVSAALGPGVLGELVKLAGEHDAGLVRMPGPDAPVSLLRTAAHERASRNLPAGDLQTQIDAVWGIWWTPALEGALTALDVSAPTDEPVPGPAERERQLTKKIARLEKESRRTAPRPAPQGAAPRGFRASAAMIRAGARGMLAELSRRLRRS